MGLEWFHIRVPELDYVWSQGLIVILSQWLELGYLEYGVPSQVLWSHRLIQSLSHGWIGSLGVMESFCGVSSPAWIGSSTGLAAYKQFSRALGVLRVEQEGDKVREPLNPIFDKVYSIFYHWGSLKNFIWIMRSWAK